MPKFLVSILLVAFFSLSGCEKHNPDQEHSIDATQSQAPDTPVQNMFETATEVRLFVEMGSDDDGDLIYQPSDGMELTATQRAEFEASLYVHTIAPNEEFTACFIPHHFFRYFDKDGNALGAIEVCFCCAEVSATGDSGLTLNGEKDLRGDFKALRSLVESLGLPTDVQC